MVALAKNSESMKRLDETIAQMPQLTMRLSHRFVKDDTTGLIIYVREVFLPAIPPPLVAVYSTRTHRKESPFVISKGVVLIVDNGGNHVRVEAPLTGVTKVGTKRAIIVLEDTIWTTFHITNTTDVDEIERQLAVETELIKGPDGSCCIPTEQPVLYMSEGLEMKLPCLK
jgi:hypothetical protein